MDYLSNFEINYQATWKLLLRIHRINLLLRWRAHSAVSSMFALSKFANNLLKQILICLRESILCKEFFLVMTLIFWFVILFNIKRFYIQNNLLFFITHSYLHLNVQIYFPLICLNLKKRKKKKAKRISTTHYPKLYKHIMR